MASLFRSFASCYKLKTHSGLKKRMKVVGTLWNKEFKFYPVGKQHLNECKSPNNLSRKKKIKTLSCKGDIKRVKKLLPYWNFSKYRG